MSLLLDALKKAQSRKQAGGEPVPAPAQPPAPATEPSLAHEPVELRIEMPAQLPEFPDLSLQVMPEAPPMALQAEPVLLDMPLALAPVEPHNATRSEAAVEPVVEPAVEATVAPQAPPQAPPHAAPPVTHEAAQPRADAGRERVDRVLSATRPTVSAPRRASRSTMILAGVALVMAVCVAAALFWLDMSGGGGSSLIVQNPPAPPPASTSAPISASTAAAPTAAGPAATTAPAPPPTASTQAAQPAPATASVAASDTPPVAATGTPPAAASGTPTGVTSGASVIPPPTRVASTSTPALRRPAGTAAPGAGYTAAAAPARTVAQARAQAAASATPAPAAASTTTPLTSPATTPATAGTASAAASGLRLQPGQLSLSAPLDEQLTLGYQALRDGLLDRAERHYREAVRLDGRNRDALLGLAAVEMRAGRLERAADLYRSALMLNPRDADAAAGLTLVGGQDPGMAESLLKRMAQEMPDSAQVHFALGSLYARLGRWSAAQESFFRTVALAPGEPDHHYNLAVSLEHLQQTRLAGASYERALALAQGRQPQFSVPAVRERIAALKAAQAVQ